MIEIIKEYGELISGVLIALAPTALAIAKLMDALGYSAAAKNVNVMAGTVMQIVDAYKRVTGLKGPQVNALVNDIVRAAIPKTTQIISPSIVAATIKSIEQQYSTDKITGVTRPQLTLDANASATEIGAAIGVQLKRARLSVRGSGVPGKSIDSARVAASVAFNLGR